MTSTFYVTTGKRALDIVASAAGLAILSPIMGATALTVRLKLGKPVVFRQERPGRHKRPFVLLKFRTMANLLTPEGTPLPDAERITPLGSVLRTSSLDELPELINVLRGDMSLVGPRPLLTRYLDHYTPTEMARFAVRPGLTGWAQVHGRNSVSWNDRLAFDAWYAENVSLLLDLKILASTARMVVFGSGVEVVPNNAMLSLDEERSPAQRG